jgi:uncharacterized membrane protein YheB (UPF0754 family)
VIAPYHLAAELGTRSVPVIRHDVAHYWYIYASMPIIAAVIGYLTKIVALEMLYRPLEFVGIGPIGWQGIVPRRSGKVAAVTIELLTANLLKPEDLLDRVDSREAVEELRLPLAKAVDEVAREIVDDLRPGLWDSLPEAVRRRILDEVHNRAPQAVDSMLAQMRVSMTQVIDLQLLTVTTLVRNKQKLNDLMRTTAGSAMVFVRRSGVIFGFGIGLIQMVAWAVIHNIWIMPIFGFVTGFFSDWIALQMLFQPRSPRKILGWTFHGVLHAKRDEITRDYARIMATDLFAPEVLFDAVMNGPGADRIVAMVQREVKAAIDAQAGLAVPVMQLTVGTARYRAIKQTVADRVTAMMSETLPEVEEYAVRTLDIENTLVEKMSQLDGDAFEGIMRPIFKDDEWLMVTVGAVLGFLVGELQVALVTHLGGG